MTTIIDNNQRRFVVQSFGMGMQRDTFCNLADIPKVIEQTIDKGGQYKILHYWNRKLARISKKDLNEMLKANSIPFKVN
jgi:hypothetical protein